MACPLARGKTRHHITMTSFEGAPSPAAILGLSERLADIGAFWREDV